MDARSWKRGRLRPGKGRCAALAIACLAALALVQLPAAAEARQTQLRGVMLTPNGEWPGTWGVSEAETVDEVRAACELGSTAIRYLVKWPLLEPARGTVDPVYAGRVEAVLDGAQACGSEVILTLLLTPCWARPKKDRCNQWTAIEPPRKPSMFGAVTRRVLRRWGDRIAALEVWNEPNQRHFWAASVEDYVEIASAAGRAAARMKSPVKILAGSLAGADRGYLRDMYREGLRWHDGISIHPYNVVTAGAAAGFTHPAMGAEAPVEPAFKMGVPRIRRMMRRQGDKRKDIWLTEFGYAACPAAGHCVEEETQARWIAESFAIAARWKYVRALTLFSLRDIGLTESWNHRFGLLRRDFSERPSYDTLKATLGALAQ